MHPKRTFGSLVKVGRYWHWKYVEDGRQRKESLGVTTKAEAEHERALRMGAPSKRSQVQRHTWADFDEDYWPWAVSHKSPRTVEFERCYWRVFADWVGVAHLEDVRAGDVERFKAWLRRSGPRGRGLQPVSVNDVLRHLQALFNHAGKLGLYAGENPVVGVARFPVDQNQADFLTRRERDVLLATAHEVSGPVFRLVLLTGFQGMRVGEALSAHSSWFDFDARLIHIPSGDRGFRVKTRKGRTVPMTELCREAFAEFRGVDAHIFEVGRGNKGKNRYRVDLRKPWARVRKASGVDRATWLLLRHTFGSILAQEGVPLIKIARWMGNTLQVCERHYVGLTAYDADIDRLND
jgi:integrase